ncbi:MAG TPA: hypothetical protein VIJ92_15645 [Ginsengibacter sp.]
MQKANKLPLRKFLFFVCCLLLNFLTVHAQSLKEQTEDAKFQIIKATIEFLSTDKETFKEVKEENCPNCKNIDDLKSYISTNKITGAEQKVLEPLNSTGIDTSPDNWKSSLTSFAKKADELITPPNKEKRKELAGYKTYKNSVSKIIDNVKQPAATEKKPPSDSGVAVKDQTPQPSVSSKVPSTETKSENTVEPDAFSSGWLKWLPWGISIVLLILLIAVFAKIKKVENNEKKLEEKYYNDYSSPVSVTSQKISSLQKELKDAEVKIKDLEADIKFEKEKFDRLNKEIKAVAADTNDFTKTSQMKSAELVNKPVTKPAKETVKNIKYARYADAGDGFSDAELLDTPDNKTIFELTISPNNKSAEFKITDNNIAQHYALSNTQYFLGKTCQYDSFPSENASIQTDTPGTLELNGAVWKIRISAKISFI